MPSTAEDALTYAAICGVEVYLRPDGTPVHKGNTPNAALLGMLKKHRDEIIIALGGTPKPLPAKKALLQYDPPERCTLCAMLVVECEDSDAFCNLDLCYFRNRARQVKQPW